MTELRRDLAAWAILAALAVGFLWRCNLGGRVMVPGDLLLIMEPWKHYSHQFPEFRRVGNPILDAVQQSYPWRKFAGEWLRRGEWPLWNPYELCGNPFLANDQSALFYPETWLHALMPTERALGWATSLYLFLSGALMYWFLRVLALRRAACLLGSIAFMFNGFVVGWLCLPAFRSVSGWLPGMLVTFELSLRGRRGLWLAACGLFTGLQFLAGNLHISLYVLMMFASYVAFRCVGLGRKGAGRGQVTLAAGGAAAALVGGGLLAAAQLLPVLEFVGMSSRAAGGSYESLLQNAIALPNLLTLLMPDLLGNPVDYNHWGEHLGKVPRAYIETAFYVGVAPVLLLPFAVRHRRFQALFWLGVALVGALLAIGTHLNAILYYLVPIFRSLSGIGRAVVMISTGISIGGALGLDGLLTACRDKPQEALRLLGKSWTVLAFIAVAAGLWAWMRTGPLEAVLPGIGAYTWLQVGRCMAALMVAGVGGLVLTRAPRLGLALLLGVLTLDMYLFVDKFAPAVRPEYLQVKAQAIETMQAPTGQHRVLALGQDPIHRMAPNTGMLFGLEEIQGSDSLELGSQRRLISAASTDTLGFLQPDPALPLIDLLGVRFVHSGVRLEGIAKLRLVSDADGYLYENTKALPRAFSVPSVRQVAAGEELSAVTGRQFRPQAEAIVGPESELEPPRLPRKAVTRIAPVTVAQHTPNAVTLSGVFPHGWPVVLTDSFYPGWRAYQGGRSLQIHRVNYSLRAVVPAQDREPIRLLFVPSSFVVGGFLGLLTAAVLAAIAVGAWRGGPGDG